MAGQGHGKGQVTVTSLWPQPFLGYKFLQDFQTFSEFEGVCDTCGYTEEEIRCVFDDI